MLYGLVIRPLRWPSLDKLEVAHLAAAKRIQGLPPHTSNPACLALLGWLSIEAQLDIQRLILLWSILCLPWSIIYKEVAVARLLYHIMDTRGRHSGPLYEMLCTARKYGLQDYISNRITEGTGPSQNQWKQLVKNTVRDRETTRWQMTTMMYSKLYIFMDAVLDIEMCVWWRVARAAPVLLHQCKLLVRVLVGEHGLGSNTGRFSGQGKQCVLCDGHYTETVEHFLFLCSCEAMHQPRVALWTELEDVMPPAMRADVMKMTLRARAAFLLSGCHSWVPEWVNLYAKILKYVHRLYQLRTELLEALEPDDISCT